MSGLGKNRILTNALTSVLQVFLAGVTLFILYRFLLKILGPENLGIWSLVLATTSVTQVANLGFPGGLVRFVAKYRARSEHELACGVVQTAAITIGTILAVVLFLGYPVLRRVLALALLPDALPAALKLLPFSMVSLWLVNVASVFQGGLDGCERYDISNYLLMASSVLQLPLYVLLSQKYGLMGLAYAGVILNGLVLAVSWILLSTILPGLPAYPGFWNWKLFKELGGYGARFQFISIIGMLNDPVTKALISRFGGLSTLGYYDMANRLVIQVRALVMSANEVVTPHFASLLESSPEKIRSAYIESYKLLFYLATPLFAVLVVCMPIVSVGWIGRHEQIFIMSGLLLSGGYLVNTLNGPAYFLWLGTGELKWNVISHVVIGVLNVGLGFLLGTIFKGIGPVIGWSIALVAGSCLVTLPYYAKNGIPIRNFIPQESKHLFIAGIITAAISILLDNGGSNLFFPFTITASLFVVVLLMSWRHPERKKLFGWIALWVSGDPK